MFGGRSKDKSFYSFSPSSQLWNYGLPDLPSGRNFHGSVVVGNSVFIVGGWDNNTIEEYNYSTKTFKTVATMNTFRRSFGICVFNEREVLVAGGLENYMATNSCLLFNTNTKKFKEIAIMETKRAAHDLVNVGGVVYSICGYNDDGVELNTIETFDLATEHWKTSDVRLHIARCYHRAVAHKYLKGFPKWSTWTPWGAF